MTFHDTNAEQVGKFDFNTLNFTGDVTESAKAFWLAVKFDGESLHDKITRLEETIERLEEGLECI
jgi:hypothetical protein